MLVNELLCANVSNMSLCCLCLVHDEHQQTGREGSSESEVRGGQEEVCVCLYTVCCMCAFIMLSYQPTSESGWKSKVNCWLNWIHISSHSTHLCTSHLPLRFLRIATIEVQIAKLDSEAWPGLLDPERDRLILINEKEELLKELQYVRPRQRLEPNDAEKLETEKKRLERDLQAARDNQSKALTERWEYTFIQHRTGELFIVLEVRKLQIRKKTSRP